MLGVIIPLTFVGIVALIVYLNNQIRQKQYANIVEALGEQVIVQLYQ